MHHTDRVFTVLSAIDFYAFSINYILKNNSDKQILIVTSSEEEKLKCIDCNPSVNIKSIEELKDSLMEYFISNTFACLLLRYFLNQFSKEQLRPVDTTCIYIAINLFRSHANNIDNEIAFLNNISQEAVKYILQKLRVFCEENELKKVVSIKCIIEEMFSREKIDKCFFLGIPHTVYSQSFLKSMMDFSNCYWVIPPIYTQINKLCFESKDMNYIHRIMSHCDIINPDVIVIGDNNILNSFTDCLYKLEIVNYSSQQEKNEFINSVSNKYTVCFCNTYNSNKSDNFNIYNIEILYITILDFVLFEFEPSTLLNLLKNPLIKFINDDDYLRDISILESEILPSNRLKGLENLLYVVEQYALCDSMKMIFYQIKLLYKSIGKDNFSVVFKIHSKLVSSITQEIYDSDKYIGFFDFEIDLLKGINIISGVEYRNLLLFTLKFYTFSQKQKLQNLNFISGGEVIFCLDCMKSEYLRNVECGLIYSTLAYDSYIKYVIINFMLCVNKVHLLSNDSKLDLIVNFFADLGKNKRAIEHKKCSEVTQYNHEVEIHLKNEQKKVLMETISIRKLNNFLFNKYIFYHKNVLGVRSMKSIDILYSPIYGSFENNFILEMLEVCHSKNIETALAFIDNSIKALENPFLYYWLRRFCLAFADYNLLHKCNSKIVSHGKSFNIKISEDICLSFNCDRVEYNDDSQNNISIVEFTSFNNKRYHSYFYKDFPVGLLIKSSFIQMYTEYSVANIKYLDFKKNEIVEYSMTDCPHDNIVTNIINEIQEFLSLDDIIIKNPSEDEVIEKINKIFVVE